MSEEAPVEGQAEVSWTDGLPDDAKGYIENKGWGGVQDVLKSYENLEKLRGVPEAQLLKLPAEGGDMGDVWNRLGRPEEASGYEIAVPEDLKDEVFDAMTTKAHEAGLTNSQWKAMQEGFVEKATELREGQAKQMAEAFETWQAANKADFENVSNMLREVGADQDQIAAAMNGDSAAFYGTLAKVAARMGEGKLVESEKPATFTMSPDAAKAKITQMMADKSFTDRLFSDDKATRMAAQKEREPLMQIASQQAEGPNEVESLRGEVARLQAQLRRNA